MRRHNPEQCSRRNALESQLDFTNPVGVVTKEAKWWVDPIVGLLVRSPDGRGAQFRLYMEIGGFGAGSELAWQIFPNVGIRLKRLGFEFGYRSLGTDYESARVGITSCGTPLCKVPPLGSRFDFEVTWMSLRRRVSVLV